MRTIAKRLRDGHDLLTEIQTLVQDEGVKAGVILSAVGSLKESKIRVPVIDGEVRFITPGNLEIDSLHGTVSTAGNHLHISVSDVMGNVHGGHLQKGCIVRTTCELVIGVLDNTTFDRQPDTVTGFDELVIS